MPDHARTQTPDILVVGDGTALDYAVVALVEKCGYLAEVVEPEALRVTTPRVAIFRTDAQLRRVIAALDGAGRVTLVGLAPSPMSRTNAGVRPVIWLRGPHADSALGRILHDYVGAATDLSDRVHISFREREVLSSYVLGATVEVTAAAHHIAVSTVKTHYRRVAERYGEAGRPVTNKTQLLVEMVADGWVIPGRSNVA
ncbi:LuxR family transcriptional regulator [Gordonia sp. TBRC 11910]|uniref:LuxR family transcriptional regulator n=1 Tax=Gordonia asplenii TaxID=2725283 RepID=A0A848L4F5_9ACTN|nr:LuxR family transcriptional regulator [Gordonia asplenii]NMO03471.1 LuxR family transcriptional regulator [Gordonia asplenii]